MSQLRFAKPPVFAAGVLGNAVGSGVMPNLPACNLGGGGDFSWLMQLDLAANTLKTGGALPVEDPLQGYCFVDQSISGTAVAPVTASATVNNGQFDALVGDLVLPFYLTGPATTPLLIPLGHAVLSGTLSPGNDCIGRYNADTLSPEDGCEPTGGITAFTEGGTINAYMSLEAADSILVQVLNQSLCVVLSGDAAQYGNGGSPNTCRRDNDGKIVFAGDWCASTNAAADSTCSDAVQVQGAYAAAGVTINGTCD